MNDQERKMQHYKRLHSRLCNAVHGMDSIINGKQIYDLLGEIETLAGDDLPDEVAASREVVDRWRAMWFPSGE